MLISIPKRTDNWKKKLLIVAAYAIVGKFIMPVDYIGSVIGALFGWILIIEEDLLYRSLMINIIDHQLIKISEEMERIDSLEIEVASLKESLREVNLNLEHRLKWGY